MRNITSFLLLFGVTLLPFTVTAQSITDLQQLSAEDRRAYFGAMSDDERSAMRDKWRGEFENMSDEDKAALRSKRSENREQNRRLGRERWESMSDEERTAASEKRKDRGKGKKKGKGNKHKGERQGTSPEASGGDQAPE
jgi:hypothetical protein